MTRSVKVYAASVGSRFGLSAENFGDNLMSHLLDGLFGLKVDYVKHSAAELLGVGSIVDSYYRKSGGSLPFLKRRPWRDLYVWGSGFMDTNSQPLWPQTVRYCAVRGPLSASRLENTGLTLGDPALLLPVIWQAPKRKSLSVGIVPHFATMTEFSKRYASSLPSGWELIDLLSDPFDIVQKIAGSDIVISSSLHGIIVADAYGVPSIWAQPDAKIKGDGFKFRDYEAYRGVPLNPPVSFADLIREGISDSLLSVSRPPEENLRALVDAFPFK